MAMIVAMDEDGFIGRGNELPWKLSSDMARFKQLTEADGFNSVIMGRKTWDSLPDAYRPLPERVNIVMSRDTNWQAEGAETALYIGRAIELAYAEGSDECWVIGGAQVYEMFLERVDEIHVTTVHTSGSGEVKFPEWDRSEWSEEVVERLGSDENNEHDSTYSIWIRWWYESASNLGHSRWSILHICWSTPLHRYKLVRADCPSDSRFCDLLGPSKRSSRDSRRNQSDSAQDEEVGRLCQRRSAGSTLPGQSVHVDIRCGVGGRSISFSNRARYQTICPNWRDYAQPMDCRVETWCTALSQ